jgi:hypothetical protein
LPFIIDFAVVSRREIRFWQRFAAQGSLESAVRAYRKRALEFFGALASMRADEDELNQILKMQITATSTIEEILADLKEIWNEKLSAVKGDTGGPNGTVVTFGRPFIYERLDKETTQKELEEMADTASSHCTPEFAEGVKKSAERYLRAIRGCEQ